MIAATCHQSATFLRPTISGSAERTYGIRTTINALQRVPAHVPHERQTSTHQRQHEGHDQPLMSHTVLPTGVPEVMQRTIQNA